MIKLWTKRQWDKASPFQQGYLAYSQAELPGSELKGVTNPYRFGSRERVEYLNGEIQAANDAADEDD